MDKDTMLTVLKWVGIVVGAGVIYTVGQAQARKSACEDTSYCKYVRKGK